MAKVSPFSSVNLPQEPSFWYADPASARSGRLIASFAMSHLGGVQKVCRKSLKGRSDGKR
jgi:hypothetical protein